MISGKRFAFIPRKNRLPPRANAALHVRIMLQVLSFPPPPVGMRPAPVRMALLVLADQNTKTHAGPAVAFFAKLMEADHFRLHRVLGVRWCCDNRSASRNAGCDHRGSHQWPK